MSAPLTTLAATEETSPPKEPSRPVEEPFTLASARAEDRPAWGFTAGCAIVVSVGLLVLGIQKSRAPHPSPPAVENASAAPDPFFDLQPSTPANLAPVVLPTQPQSHGARPKVHPGPLSVSGRLPVEVIGRILRQNYGRLRLCYEAGLRNNPNLQGRITTLFIIGRDGAVSSAQNGGSDLPDAGVVSCVVRALRGLSFPQPEGGIVTVSYPVTFQPR